MDFFESDDIYFDLVPISKPSQTLRGKTLVSQNNAYQLQLQRYEIFKEQNPETGNFDLTLEFVDGKKLYVHKFFIISVSETLNAMLSDRWSKNDDRAVKIEAYSSDNFFQFLSFLYSGDCDLTDENIFQLTDMAEFYGIQTLRDFCDSYLSKMECILENFFDMLELQERYSLKGLIVSLEHFFGTNVKELVNVQKFLTLKKSGVKLLSSFKRLSNSEEDFFKAVYKWAEGQTLINHAVCDEQDFNMNDAIKNELSEILPLVKFARMKYEFVKSLIVAEKYVREKQVTNPAEKFNLKNAVLKELNEYIPFVKFTEMSFEFLVDFVVENGFIFKTDDLKKIILNARKRYSSEEEFFQSIYRLVEKQSHAKKCFWFNNSESYDFEKTMKAEFSKIIPYVKFHRMSKIFLTDFVVKNGVLSVDEAERVFPYWIVAENNGKTLIGAFVDVFGIQKAIEPRGYSLNVLSTSNKQRFTRLKFEIPKTPSPLKKMKGVEWYLALEKCGTLVLQSYGNVKASDYLIAEMQTRDDFTLSKGSWTRLKSFVKTDD
uniref:BTB domain-containing protein n=1 Tax=Panagrolaimus davidi TaxID=227884 RepID=A0A914RAU0_9BILA